MILVDTSIWIGWLGKKKAPAIDPDQLLLVATCPPILQEILQGIRQEVFLHPIQESLLALPRVGDPVTTEDYLEAAEIYRMGRRKGFTIRSSVDCLIAAIALREKIELWHHDRDFQMISQFTDLRIRDSF